MGEICITNKEKRRNKCCSRFAMSCLKQIKFRQYFLVIYLKYRLATILLKADWQWGVMYVTTGPPFKRQLACMAYSILPRGYKVKSANPTRTIDHHNYDQPSEQQAGSGLTYQ